MSFWDDYEMRHNNWCMAWRLSFNLVALLYSWTQHIKKYLITYIVKRWRSKLQNKRNIAGYICRLLQLYYSQHLRIYGWMRANSKREIHWMKRRL